MKFIDTCGAMLFINKIDPLRPHYYLGNKPAESCVIHCSITEEHHRYKAVTYRLYPNSTTARKLESTLGCCCDLYNMLLED